MAGGVSMPTVGSANLTPLAVNVRSTAVKSAPDLPLPRKVVAKPSRVMASLSDDRVPSAFLSHA